MNITKNILIFYFIMLMFFAISAIGVYLLNEEVAKLYLGTSYTIIPLLAILSIINSQINSKTKSK